MKEPDTTPPNFTMEEVVQRARNQLERARGSEGGTNSVGCVSEITRALRIQDTPNNRSRVSKKVRNLVPIRAKYVGRKLRPVLGGYMRGGYMRRVECYELTEEGWLELVEFFYEEMPNDALQVPDM